MLKKSPRHSETKTMLSHHVYDQEI